MRILVVEDAPLIRGFTVEALREEGYDVIHASTGVGLGMVHAAGRGRARHRHNATGKVDGWQIAERCREHDPGLPVIYATGFSPVAARPVPGSLSL